MTVWVENKKGINILKLKTGIAHWCLVQLFIRPVFFYYKKIQQSDKVPLDIIAKPSPWLSVHSSTLYYLGS
jgi:hypothetical protein